MLPGFDIVCSVLFHPGHDGYPICIKAGITINQGDELITFQVDEAPVTTNGDRKHPLVRVEGVCENEVNEYLATLIQIAVAAVLGMGCRGDTVMEITSVVESQITFHDNRVPLGIFLGTGGIATTIVYSTKTFTQVSIVRFIYHFPGRYLLPFLVHVEVEFIVRVFHSDLTVLA